MICMNMEHILFIFSYRKKPGMVWDKEPNVYKPPPKVEEDLKRECTNDINVVRAEIPHLQDQIKSMTTYSQRQMDEARDALNKVKAQEEEVEKLR